MSNQIQNLTNAQLVAVFNDAIAAHSLPNIKPVAKFASRHVAIERVEKLATNYGLQLVQIGDGQPHLAQIPEGEPDYSDDGGNAIDPSEDSEDPSQTGSVEDAEQDQPEADGTADDASGEDLTQPQPQPEPLRQQIEKAASKRKAAKKEAKAKIPGKRGPAPEYADDLPVAYGENRKKVGSASHARYAAYSKATTVGEAIALGATRDDLRWDAKHGFVVIG